MSNPLKLAALLLSVSMLSACGGGGADGGDPVDPPPVDPVPTRNSTITEKVAFAEKGSTIQQSWRDNTSEKWNRIRNCSGNGVCVQVDRLAGSDIGLVQYTHGGQDFIYDLTGNPVTNVSLPAGQYNGPLNVHYRTTPNGNWVASSGEMNITLHMASGTAALGGIVDYTNSQGAASSIQIFGDAQVANGELVDNATQIVVDGSGADQEVLTGETNGVLSHGTDADAIIGTIGGASNSGFQMQGGFVTIFDPRYPLND